MSLLLPKNRRPRFRVILMIQDLSNVPLVSGLVHVRWHLRDSIRAEARGKTERSSIKDHKVEWGYEITWTVNMTIEKDKKLHDEILEFEVYQEMYGGKEKHALGKLQLNLAEYADCSELISRRYLLQQSKVNSTLKLGLRLHQLSGDTDFQSPDLKKAQIFGGITGLLSEGKEIKERDEEMGYGLKDDTAVDKVALDLEQDIYRNSLTRRWQAEAGELDPADVIDDIFKGGDGWLRPYKTDESSRNPQYDAADHSRSRADEKYHMSHADHAREQPEQVPMTTSTARQEYEADEMLRNLAWTINPERVELHAGKSAEQRAQANE